MRRLFAGLTLSVGSVCAWAQSSVSVYGIMDSGLYYQSKSSKASGSSFSALDGAWAPSVWGLRGTEDLGGGYSTEFKLGSGFSTTNGGFGNSNGNLFGWNSYVGVNGPLGQIHAGVQFSPFFMSLVNADARGGPQYASHVSVYFDHFGGTGLFDSNSVIYTSPTIGGLSGSVEYAFGNVAGSVATGRHVSAALNFSRGPVSATLAYFQANNPNTSDTAFIGENAGVGYAIGPLTFHLSYTKYRNQQLTACNDVNVYAGGLQWTASPFLVFNAAVYVNHDVRDAANESILVGAGAQYLLSKRTTLYTQLGVVNNRGAMRTSIASNAPASFLPGQGTTTGVTLGIQHLF